MSIAFRAFEASDFARALDLNTASVRFLSPMDGTRLALLLGRAAWCDVAEVDGETAGFLMAFREGSAYDSANYRWFAERYERFLYIDRVVVDERHRGAGIASRLYERAFQQAKIGAVPWLTCEFDVEPPNPVSERFHAKFGFQEVGRQRYGDANKVVALQAAPAARP